MIGANMINKMSAVHFYDDPSASLEDRLEKIEKAIERFNV